MIIMTYQILINPVLYLLYMKICINNAITTLLTVSKRFPSNVANLTYRVRWNTFYVAAFYYYFVLKCRNHEPNKIVMDPT